MNIIYCYDDNYKELAEISSKSFQKHNPNATIHGIYCHDIDDFPELKEFTNDLCGFTHVSRACFLRLLIPKLFPHLDRALYLDCDTLCQGDISELYNTDFENNYIVATRGHSYSDIQARQLGFPWYIISGMLLMNIPLMNKENYFQQIKDNWRGAIGKQEPFSGDETIINWVFHNKIKLVPEKWNYCYKREYGERKCESPKILHIVGADKSKMYD